MSAILTIRIGRDRADAELVRWGRVLWTSTAECRRPDDMAAVLAAFAAAPAIPPRGTRLRAFLTPPLVQLRTLRGLPPVRREALRALVALQAGRFFRSDRGRTLVTDAAWERRGPEPVARAVAVDEWWSDAIAAAARATGFRLERIAPASDDAGAGGEAFDLRSPAERVRRRRAEWVAARRLAIVAALLWTAAVGVLAGRVIREDRRIQRELATLSAPAKALATARRRLTDAARAVEAIERTERDRTAILTRVAAIAGALPDSAYLTSLRVDANGNGSLTGAAKHAAQVVASLERVGATGPRLVGPAMREQSAGHDWERFTVDFGQGATR